MPKTSDLLGRFLSHSENTGVLETAELTAEEVKAVWQHHFGLKLIMGPKVGMGRESEEVKPIKTDHHIAGQVTNLFKKGRVWNKTAGGLAGLLDQLSSERRIRSLLTRKCPSMWPRLMAGRSSRTRASGTRKRSAITCRTS